MGQCVSKLCVSPTGDTCRYIALIVCDRKQLHKSVPDGTLVMFDVLEDLIVAVANEYIVSAEILKFCNDGRHILTATQQPCQIHLFDSESLDIIRTVSYAQYCPFLHLPFVWPDKVEHLSEQDTLLSLPVSKTVISSQGLKGLTLLASKMYFLFPVLSKEGSDLVVIHFNVADPVNDSKVDLHHKV